jgi:hypothetical protein
MSNTPSPLSGSFQNDNTFSNRASIACLLSPLILAALGFAFHYANHSLSGPNLSTATMVFAGVSCLLMCVGSIMGILALLLMKSGGRTRIVICSLGGLAFLSVQIAQAIPSVLKARARTLQREENIENVTAASKDLNREAVQSLKTNGPGASLNKLSQVLDQAAKTSTGEDAQVWKASQAYLLRMQAVQLAYQAASSNLTAARVLSTSNLDSREALMERRAVVQEFLKSNADLKNFLSNGEDNFRAELVRLKVSQATIDSAIIGFHKSSAAQLPVVAEIRTDDDRIGRGMLTVLDLLDVNWGHWSYNPETGHVRFESTDLVEQYNADLKGITEAATEQAASQGRLVKIVSQGTMQ